MNRTAFFVFCILSITILTGITIASDTTVLNQRIRDCTNNADLTGTIEQGDKIEAKLTVLITNEKEIVLYSQLKDVTFYLEEDQISTNNTVAVTLQPGTHNVRAVGEVPIGVDGQKILLISSDNIAKYVTATLSSPYVLKTSAYIFTIITGVSCAIIAGLVVLIASRNKVHRVKSKMSKKTEDIFLTTRTRLRDFLKLIALNLNDMQKKEAKKLLQELEQLKQ
jgi:hypothetical protein